jgi:hypothetical protein
MKKIFYYAPIVLTVILTGCASNRQQIAENASGDGMLAKAAVPIPSVGSIGLSLFVGRFSTSSAINPTSTNTLHAASISFTGYGRGKQSVIGSITNGAGIGDASVDVSSTSLGETSVTNTNISSIGHN